MFELPIQGLAFETIDYFLLAYIAIGIPLAGYVSQPIFKSRLVKGDKKVRLKTYAESVLIMGPVFIVVLASWIGFNRPLSGLGISFEPNTAALGVLAFTMAAILLLFWQVRLVSKSKAQRAILKKQIADAKSISEIMPKTREEYTRFNYLSIFAGVTEEIVFRAYLIWAFSFWVNIWLASILALAVFVLSHLYQQNVVAVFKVGVVGAIMTALYLVSGSIIPAILLHIVMDITSNMMVWNAQKLK